MIDGLSERIRDSAETGGKTANLTEVDNFRSREVECDEKDKKKLTSLLQ